MGALVTCGTGDVLAGRIHMPLRGAWWADLKIDLLTPPSGKVTIASAGGLSLTGTVVRSGAFLDSSHIRVYGGAGGTATVMTPSSYRNTTVGDPLRAIIGVTGDALASSIVSSLLSASLSFWSTIAETFARALDNLCGAAGRALGQTINWRFLSDGSLWLGAETWPQQQLASGSDQLWVSPVGPRYELGVSTLTLVPGVNVTDLGANISGVDHWIDDAGLRTWAWA